MSGASVKQESKELLEAAVSSLQRVVELQSQILLKDRRCSKCNRFLCKSEGRTEIKCKCGHLNKFY